MKPKSQKEKHGDKDEANTEGDKKLTRVLTDIAGIQLLQNHDSVGSALDMGLIRGKAPPTHNTRETISLNTPESASKSNLETLTNSYRGEQNSRAEGDEEVNRAS